MSGAFGGLIAFGLIRIETGALVGWQYLYIVEGSLSVLAGPLAYFWIPRELPKAWFYNAEEKIASAKRANALIKANQHTDKFSWREVFKGLTAWQVSWCTLPKSFMADQYSGYVIRCHPILD
jgi:MFS family permease